MMKHIGTIPIETDRLILRRFEMTDAEAMFANWCGDPEVTKYLMWKTHDSVDETRSVIKDIWLCHYDEPDFYQWAIVIKATNEIIGSIGVVKHDDQTRMVHIGYCIGRAWWRHGYTSEALCRLVHFFFEDVGVNRIESRHDPRNPNSGRVMQKAGLRYEGTSLESDWNNQGICDAANYAILAKDYFQKSPQTLSVTPLYRRADQCDIDAVTDLLCKLYDMQQDELYTENKQHFASESQAFFLAFDGDKPIGVSHGSLRREYVNGTNDGLKGYLEAIYVLPEYRRNGIAAELVKMAERWAARHGCREFASDCLLDNTESYRFHLKIGFMETERCIFFLKAIEKME